MKQTFRPILLAITLFTGLFTMSAAAQTPSARYVIHLAHATQWGPATLAPGAYLVTSQLPYPMLTVSGRGITLNNGKHPAAVFLTASAVRTLSGESVTSAVVLNERGNAVRVASMRLGEPGVELRFTPPATPSMASGSSVAGRP